MHEKLVVYRQLLAIAEELARRMTKWPRGHAYLTDQLRRAMYSAVLNLCEGNGKSTQGRDRKNFFRIAMGSLSEVSAYLDLALIDSLLPTPVHNSLKSELRHAYFRIRKLP